MILYKYLINIYIFVNILNKDLNINQYYTKDSSLVFLIKSDTNKFNATRRNEHLILQNELYVPTLSI